MGTDLATRSVAIFGVVDDGDGSGDDDGWWIRETRQEIALVRPTLSFHTLTCRHSKFTLNNLPGSGIGTSGCYNQVIMSMQAGHTFSACLFTTLSPPLLIPRVTGAPR